MNQNRKRIFTIFLFTILFVGMFLSALAAGLHQKALKKILEFSLNQNTKEFFSGTLHIGDLHLHRDLKIRMNGIKGQLQSEKGPTPVLIQSVESEGPVTDYFSSNGLSLRFRGLRISSSSNQEGIDGVYQIRGGRKWFLNVEAEILRLGLEEMEWVSPENLQGSNGLISGDISFQSDSNKKTTLQAKLRIREPGGELQARFFDLLMPYLPQVKLKRSVRRMAHQLELIHFQNASMDVDMNQPDQMKILLQILIPDYNLNLNLNIEVHVDEKNSFARLAQLVGLIKVK